VVRVLEVRREVRRSAVDHTRRRGLDQRGSR
jgi:hypothetical protein